MSYCAPADAEELVGQSVSQKLLNVARSIIDRYSWYRWEATTEVLTFSAFGGEHYFYLKCPITTFTKLEVDLEGGSGFEEKTEDTDFYARKDIGEIHYPAGLPSGHDNIRVTYTYGYTSSDKNYPAVQMAEAQIALFLKRNPAMLARIGLEKASMQFQPGSPIRQYLSLVPVPEDLISFSPTSMFGTTS